MTRAPNNTYMVRDFTMPQLEWIPTTCRLQTPVVPNSRVNSFLSALHKHPDNLRLSPDTHWISYSVSESCADRKTRSRNCIVSVILDGDARSRFDVIRLIIVAGRSEMLDQLRIREGPQVNSRKQQIYRPKIVDRESGRIQTHSRTCTVIYEAIDTSDHFRNSVALIPISQFSALRHLRVVYDHAQICSPSHYVLFQSIESTEYFHPIPRNDSGTRGICGSLVHTARVVPVNRPRSPRSSFSAEVVSCIVEMAIGGKLSGWRRELLAYSLVCKDWVHVLGLFFKSLHVQPNDDKPNALHVAHSLTYHPYYARLIRSFSPTHYTPLGPHRYLQMWLHFISILQKATRIEELELESVPGPVSSILALSLSKLRNIRRFYMPKGVNGTHAFDMHNIQMFIARWHRLRVLEIGGWAATQTTAGMGHQSLGLHFECKIQELCLDTGNLTDAQLTRFLSSPSPSLQVLKLHGIWGLSNIGFTYFLLQVAQTLTHLSICNSPITCTETGEEFALDAVMAKMENLVYLKVADVHLTALTIARKTRKAYWPVTAPGTVQKSTIKIHRATDELRLDHLEQAIRSTGWDNVEIVWKSLDLDAVLVERARHAAEKRGVFLACRTRGRPLHCPKRQPDF